MEKKYKEFIINFFLNRVSTLPEGVEDKNYFEAGLIDSFGIIELIDKIETTFNIKLNESHFQDRRFSTINGLCSILIGVKNE